MSGRYYKVPHYEVRQFFVGKKDIDVIVYQTFVSMKGLNLNPKHLVMSRGTNKNMAADFGENQVTNYLTMDVHVVEDVKDGEIWMLTQKGWGLL